MSFSGLFIGIDKYESPSIPWLSCARNDALALHSLFQDTLGGSSTCLLDGDANKLRILEELENLDKSSVDDFIVITFSGHGSNTHELICFDSDADNLSDTSISFIEIFERFKRISSKKLLFVLDCCFSGGFGCRTFASFIAERNHVANDALSMLSGSGRLILTASSPEEPAWEDGKKGHGFLSYFLLEALQGSPDIVQAGKIDVYLMLKSITEKVMLAANAIGKSQTPSVSGSIDGVFKFPPFKTGHNFFTNFPKSLHKKVTGDINSLNQVGFPESVVNIWRNLPSLNDLQVNAINDYGILRGEHLVVSAPTSSGKTMIGELAAISGMLQRKRSIFLFPLKALVNDKHQEFLKKYDTLGLKTIRATGDSNDEVPLLLRGRYDICLMTYEKFTSILLGYPHILEQLGTIVIDEVQMIADKSRGVNLEFILTVLKTRRRYGVEPQLICLSAVIGDTNGFEDWLGAKLLKRTIRPVPLVEGVILSNGLLKTVHSETGEETIERGFIRPEYIKNSSQDYIKPLVRKLINEGKQVIVFRQSRGEAKGAAKYLADYLGLPPATRALERMAKGDLSLASEKLTYALQHGVAFHVSDLDREERLIIEETFREKDSPIRVITATTTLAMGVNTPAEAVILAGLEHPGAYPVSYTIAEYKNIIGRAGRLGFADVGSSYLLALSSIQEHNYWHGYVKGQPEDIQSMFFENGTDPRSLIVRTLVAARSKSFGTISGMDASQIQDFLQCSFGSFLKSRLYQGWTWDPENIRKALDNLSAHDMVLLDNEGRYRLTALGWLAGERGVEVETITRLIEILKPVPANEITDPLLIAATQLSVELDQIYVPVNHKGPGKEMESWKGELRNQSVHSSVLSRLGQVSELKIAASRYKKAVACLLWVGNNSVADIEKIMTRHGGFFDGFSGPLRSTATRTRDILMTTARVAEILNPGLQLEERAGILFTRLEVGVPSKLFDLAKHVGTLFSRADYQQFLKADCCGIEDIVLKEDDELLLMLGGDANKLLILKDACLKLKEKNFFAENVTAPTIPLYEA